MSDEKDQSPAPELAELAQVKVRVEPPESYVYSNISGLALSAFDVRLHFAEVMPSSETSPKIRTVAGIVIPPEHAAALVLLLMQQLQEYEKQFGAIRHSPWRDLTGVLKRISALKEG